jgi:hypothetical protein
LFTVSTAPGTAPNKRFCSAGSAFCKRRSGLSTAQGRVAPASVKKFFRGATHFFARARRGDARLRRHACGAPDVAAHGLQKTSADVSGGRADAASADP